MTNNVENIDRRELLELAWSQLLRESDSSNATIQRYLFNGEVSLSAIVSPEVRPAKLGVLIVFPGGGEKPEFKAKNLGEIQLGQSFQSQDQRWCLPIFLDNSDRKAVFATLACDLWQVISNASGSDSAVTLLTERLKNWCRMLSKRSTPLSEQEVQGLIGELTSLREISVAFGWEATLEAWKGPEGALHDFELPDFRIEVKTWSRAAVPSVFISNPHQLVIDEHCPVWLHVLQVVPDQHTGATLPELVERICADLSFELRTIFISKLAEVGYLDAHRILYTTPYEIQVARYYQVKSSFPLLDVSTVPLGVENISYSLVLDRLSIFQGCPDFCLLQ